MKTSELKVGMKVKNKKTGEIDIVVSFPGIPEYDSRNFRDADKGFWLKERLWKHREDYEPVTPHYAQYIGKKYAVHCTTQEEWDRVQAVLVEKCPINAWYRHKEETHCTCDSVGFGMHPKTWNYRGEGYTILTVAEFFGEEEVEQKNVIGIDMGSEDGDCSVQCTFMGDGKFLVKSINHKPNIIKKTMNIIQKALRTKEQKAFEYFGFGTPETLNEAGREAFLDYIYETGDNSRAGFQAKLVELHLEATKK